MAKIKILLIEDNRLLREGIAAMLNAHKDFEVINQSDDGDSVRQLKNKAKIPNIVLLDLGLEKESSLKLMATLQKELPTTKVIAMDILPDHVEIVEFVKAGGCGLILKNATSAEYIKTIQDVADGIKVLPPVLTKPLFTEIIEMAIKEGLGIPEEAIQLTNREREIVNLISEGLSNKEISLRLHIATYTVKNHVHNILEKLTLSTRLQIAAFSRKRDIKK
jgi:DNA-binding NarL/FixJ family response regulator